MKKLRYRYLLSLVLILFINFSLPQNSFAQIWSDPPPSGGGGAGQDPGDFGTEDPPDGGGFPDPDLPIDTNIVVLVVAVVGYGLKKWWDVKQNRKRNLQPTTASYKDFIK